MESRIVFEYSFPCDEHDSIPDLEQVIMTGREDIVDVDIGFAHRRTGIVEADLVQALVGMCYPYIGVFDNYVFCRLERGMQSGVNKSISWIGINVYPIVSAADDAGTGLLGRERLKEPEPGGGVQCDT